MSTTAVLTLLLGVAALSVLAPSASAAATYTFYASGSAVGETSPGVPRDYTLNLTNLNASSAISFNLSVVALPQGWSGQLSQSAVTVPASGTRQVTLSVTPPSTALADAVGKFVNVTATPDDNTVAQTVATTTRVTETFGVSLTIIAQAGTAGDPGTNVSWLAYLKNTGNSQQTYTVTVDNASYTNTNLTTNLVTVEAGATRVIGLWINISQTAPVGNLNSYIRAVSTANSSSQQTVTFTASVNAKRAVSLRGLTTDDLVKQTESEATIVFTNIIVANDGNVADSYVLQGTANASRHGSWVSFATPNITLAAFFQQYLSVTVTVPASASATGDYTVEFRIISTNSTAVIGFLNLTVTVTPKHDLSITFDSLVAKLSGDPGTVVSFPVNVSNPGAFTQTVNLSYAGVNGGWVTIFSSPFTLSPGTYRIAYYNFTIPGTQGPMEFTFQARGAINWSTPSRDRSLSLTLEVNPVYGVLASSGVSQRSGAPGSTVTFNVSVRNNGTGADNFTLQVTNATQAGLVTLSATTLMLVPAGSSQNVTVSIEVQSSPLPAAASYYYTVTATSSGNPSRSSSVGLTLMVDQVYSLSTSVSPSYRTADPGSPASYNVMVTNNGNGADTVTMQKAGVNQSWIGIGTSSASIPAGGSANFTVTVTSPTWAAVGDTALAVRAVSSGNANVTSTALFTVSINAAFAVALEQAGGNITNGHRNTTYLVSFILRNSGNQPDTFTISIGGTDASWVTLPGNNFSLNANANMTIDLAVSTGAAPTNGNHTFTIAATSVGSTIPPASAPFTVTINDVFRPEIRILAANYPTTPGASVTVSYSLRNNGTLMDTILLVATAQFPTLQQFNRTVSLTPGATSAGNFVFVASHPFTGVYAVTILATSTVEPAASAEARSNITLEVIRQFEFQAANSQAPGGPGDTLLFELTIRNVGNITDTYSFIASPGGFNWTVALSVPTITLPPGGVGNITVTVTAPTVLPGTTTQYSHQVVAASTTDASVDTVLTLSVSVSYSVRLQLAGTGSDLPLSPGSSGSFTVVLNNTGSARDTYTLTASGLAAPWVTMTPPVVTLDPQETVTITVAVAVPANALEGGRPFRVTAAPSSGATLSNNELAFTVTVLPVLSFAVTGTDTPVPVVPGQSAQFIVTITNTGNAVDTYSLVATLPQYVTFSPTDLSLGALETGNVSVTYAAPTGATAGQQTLKVQVFGSSGVPADVFLNASVQVTHNISAAAVPPGTLSGTAMPGGQVDLTFEVSNRGNGPDTANWSVQGPAASWTPQTRGAIVLAAGTSTLVTLRFNLPSDATAGPNAFTVEVVAQGQSVSTARIVNGTILVGALPGLTFSLDPTTEITLEEVTVDRAAPGSLEYTGYLRNTGNRVEELTLTRQTPQGQGWTVLIDGSATLSVSIAPGTTREVRIEISGFPSNAENATMSVTVQSGDGRIDRSVSVAISFARGVPSIDANSISVSGTHTDAQGSFTVQVTVRNIGPGTLTQVTVELRKDGSLMVDSAPLSAVPPGGTAQVTLTWETSQADANAPHTLSVALAGRDAEVLVPGTFTVERTEQTFIQRLTSDSLLPMLLIGGLLVGFVGGLIARGGKKRKGPSKAAAPVDQQAAALAGLDELEAEGEGAVPAEVAAAAPAIAAPGMEHKVICPNCAMEQWIVGKEGECPNCGVLIEVDEGSPEGEESKGESG